MAERSGLVGVLMNPAATATVTCTVNSGVTVGDVPDSLTVTTANGETFTLNRQQLTHAATIIETGSQIDGVTRDGLVIASKVHCRLGRGVHRLVVRRVGRMICDARSSSCSAS